MVDSKNDQANKSTYIAAGNQSENANLDRLYNIGSTKLLHNLMFKLPNFGAVIFNNNEFAGIKTGLQNSVLITTNKEHSSVSDRDTLTKEYQNNNYLTNNRREIIIDIRPTLTFSKSTYKSLSNRYLKSFSAKLNLGTQFYNQNSSSGKAFQQFSRAYQKFVPMANLNYFNRQIGSFTNNFSLLISTSSDYPTVQQLTPLVDSANQNFIQKGNPNLKEQNSHTMNFYFSHGSEKSKNILTYYLSIYAIFINNNFTNSSTIDSLRRTVNTIVNAEGSHLINIFADIKKAYKIKNSQLQFSFSPNISFNKSPNYVNGILSYYNNFSQSYNPSINYTYKDWLTITIGQKQSYSRSKQTGINTLNLTSLVSQSEVSLSINCTKKLTLGSNTFYTKNSYNGAQVKTFTLLNATANYRLFKGNTAEIKFAALDLLHQNTGLINYGSNNTITQGTINVLQQYFMLMLAYFPRKFGK